MIGRRGGKSFILALVAVFLACFHDWRPYLGPGERATVMIIAADRRQARTIMRYVKGLLKAIPMLRQLIEAERVEGIDLTNRITIEIHTSNFRTVRGYTIVAALLDEIAFWQGEDSSSPDSEIVSAIKPALGTVAGSMMLCASSPYARHGVLYQAYQRHFGKDGDPVLVWQSDTRSMNPCFPQHVVDEALEEDPAKYSAEYLGQFRADIEGFVSLDVIQACIDRGVYERPYSAQFYYQAFTDPSGGSGDSFALTVCHREGDVTMIDCLREIRAPFDPSVAVQQLADTLKSYHVTRVVGDRYGGGWPVEAFRAFGITYQPSERSKSDLYVDALPLLNSGRVRLLDNKRAVAQLLVLERRTARSGKDSIDHAEGAHDDLANVICGAVVLTAARKPQIVVGCQDGSALYQDGQGGWLRKWPGKDPPHITIQRVDEQTALKRRGLS